MKPGWKTSEFWLTVALLVGKTLVPTLPDQSIYAVAAYALSRGVAKATAPAPATTDAPPA